MDSAPVSDYSLDMDLLSLCDTTPGFAVHLAVRLLTLAAATCCVAAIPHLETFVKTVKKKYIKTNPYHNFLHGVAVLQAGLAMFRTVDERNSIFAPEERFAFAIACLTHDIGHDGHGNGYHKTFETPLFKQYGASSTLETMHFAITEKILGTSGTDLLKGNPKEKEMMEWIRRWIMVTDLAVGITATNERMHEFAKQNGGLNLKVPEQRILALELMMHAADLNGSFRPPLIMNAWANLVQEENFRAGDDEKQRHKQPIDAFNRLKTITPAQMAGGHLGFVNKFFDPTMNELLIGLPQLKPAMEERIHLAKSYWESFSGCGMQVSKTESGGLSLKGSAPSTTATTSSSKGGSK